MSSTPDTVSSSMRALKNRKPRQPFGPRPRARGGRRRLGAAPARARRVIATHRKRSALIDVICGPGRDLKAFAELSRTALPSEGSARFAIMAYVGSGCEGCSWIPRARSLSLRSYKLQDNIYSLDRLETARHTANDNSTCVSKRIHAAPLNASSAVIAAMAFFSKLSAGLNTQVVPVSREAPRRNAHEEIALATCSISCSVIGRCPRKTLDRRRTLRLPLANERALLGRCERLSVPLGAGWDRKISL
jgi:hypothetical protein